MALSIFTRMKTKQMRRLSERAKRRIDDANRITFWQTLQEHGPDDMVYMCLRVEQAVEEDYPDNVFGRCAACNARIKYRPWVPEGVTKWCVECVQASGEANE